MKYIETKGKKIIDWNSRIDRLDTVSPEELGHWEKEAYSWVTCACGNQCDIIPRKQISGAPIDERLTLLGSHFYGAMVRRNKNEAKTILKEIEKRSEELISIELEKQQTKSIPNPNSTSWEQQTI